MDIASAAKKADIVHILLPDEFHAPVYKKEIEASLVYEVEKHVLSIKNSLINLTVYYYPIFEVRVSEKGKKRVLKYDPILEKII